MVLGRLLVYFPIGFWYGFGNFSEAILSNFGGGGMGIGETGSCKPKSLLNCQVERMLWQHCWHEFWKLFNSNFRFGAFRCWIFCFKEVRRVQRSHSLPSGVTLTIIDSQPASKVRGGQWME